MPIIGAACAVCITCAGGGGGVARAASPTAEQATAAARRIEAAISTHKPDVVAAMVDEAALFARMMDPLPADEATHREMGGPKGTLAAGLVRQLTTAVGTRGSMRLLGVFDEAGETRARYRLITTDGTLGYYDMVLTIGTGDDRDVHIADIVVHATGQPVSRMLRRAVLGRVIERHPDWRDKLDDTERAWVKYVGRLDQMHAHAAAGRYEAALSLHARLPAPLDADRSLMLEAVEWSSHLEKPEAFAAAVARYHAAFGDDAPLTMLLLRRVLAADSPDAAAAMTLVDRLDALLGPDAYLHLLRGRIESKRDAADSAAKARTRYEQAAAGAPDVADVYYPLIDDALARKDWPAVTRWLLAAENHAGVVFGDLSKSPGFEAYAASAEYETWTNRKSD